MTKPTKPTEPGNMLALKLSEVAREVAYVQKDATNDYHKYSYASAEAVLRKVNAALTERKIALGSSSELVHYEAGNAIVRLTLRFIDAESGEIIAAQGMGQGQDKGDKAVMKANTAALKYLYANVFTISWGDDPEADSATDNKRKARSPKPKPGFKTVFTREELESELSNVNTAEELAAMKGKILTMKGTEDYRPLIAAFRERKGTLNE
jgi:hypothetical protein